MLEGIIIGVFLGGFIGVAFMAILQVGRLGDGEDQEDKMTDLQPGRCNAIPRVEHKGSEENT